MNDKKAVRILRKIGIRGCEVLATINELQSEGPANFMRLKNHESLSHYSEKQIRTTLEKLVQLGLEPIEYDRA